MKTRVIVAVVSACFFQWTWPSANAEILAVDSVAMSVRDLDRSVDFYTRVLSFQKISETELAGEEAEKLYGVFGVRVRIARIQLGDEVVELRHFLAPEGRPIEVDAKSNDQSFQHVAIIVRDMDKAYQHLRMHHVRHASSGPQRLPDWNKAAGGIKAFYFKDPDGHPLEILEFPKGKGDPKWANKSGLFLGIDHTAIVVRSTHDSLKFYRDVLGMKKQGESVNYGPEQEQLNNVRGARLRITGLRSPSGPGVEFLEYLQPTTGRPASNDVALNDLAATQTIFKGNGIESDLKPIERDRWISSGVTPAGASLRDPDGHAVLIKEN